MKVVAISGSARKDGNTAILIRYVFAELEKSGIETELVQLAGNVIRGCTACYQCWEKQDRKCAIKNDLINSCLEKMAAADAIILGSPSYFADVSAEMKAVIDRTGMVARANGDLFRRKVGAAVVAVRRGGAHHVFTTLNNYFTIGQMIIPGSNYWNHGMGKAIGDVEQDEEGIKTMQVLGENMAWLLDKLGKE